MAKENEFDSKLDILELRFKAHEEQNRKLIDIQSKVDGLSSSVAKLVDIPNKADGLSSSITRLDDQFKSWKTYGLAAAFALAFLFGQNWWSFDGNVKKLSPVAMEKIS